MGGLAVAAARIVEVEDDFASETNCRFAHVLRLKVFRGFNHDLLGRGGHDVAVVHHRLNRIVYPERDLAVGTKREVLALDDDLASDVDLANLATLRMAISSAMSTVSKVPRVRTRARNAFFPFESHGLTGARENAILSPDASRKVDILTFRFPTIDLFLSHEWAQQSYYINFPASLQ